MLLKFSCLSILRSTLAVAGLVFVFSAAVFAQSPLPAASPQKDEKLEPMEEEMRVKREIRQAQKQHKENVNRAQEISCLGAEVETTFKQKNHLDRGDLKKLDRLEKLTKSIRSAAGGSDDATETEDMPSDLPAVVSKMAELSNTLKDEVEKTPRQVVSTAVIDQANVLLELIRRVRGLSPRT